MATLREYYDTDCKFMRVSNKLILSKVDQTQSVEIEISQIWDFDANAKYWNFYIPTSPDIWLLISSILEISGVKDGSGKINENCNFGDMITKVETYHDYNKRSSENLVHTRSCCFYIDQHISVEDRRLFIRSATSVGFTIDIYDRAWAEMRSKSQKPMAFISHDSRDKDTFVRELAFELSKQMCPVWYDEFSLQVGDSLRESIEAGLKETKKCILILSENFLSNDGWGKREYDSIFTRELIEKKDCILPIWHNVSKEQIYEYSPSLANKVAIQSSLGAAGVATKLKNVIIQA